MRISLLNGSTIYHLAGQAWVSERVHSSAAELSMSAQTQSEVADLVGSEVAALFDRKNLVTSLSFQTHRLFATAAEALLFAADYDGTFARTGTLRIDAVLSDGSVTRRTLANALVDPPQRDLRGATLTLDYKIQGAAIAAGTNPLQATVTAAGVVYKARDVGTYGNGITVGVTISGTGAAVTNIAVSTLAIVITCGSNTTRGTVAAAVNGSASASLLVSASAAAPSSLITGHAATALTGGTD